MMRLIPILLLVTGCATLLDDSHIARPARPDVAHLGVSSLRAAAVQPPPTAAAALQVLRQNTPTDLQMGVVWGDARIGNIIFAVTCPAAVLDWEMVCAGSPETDLAWTLFLDRLQSEGIGVPKLEGFPSREETVARYEELSGHEVKHLHYYEIFAGFRFTVIGVRLAQQRGI